MLFVTWMCYRMLSLHRPLTFRIGYKVDMVSHESTDSRNTFCRIPQWNLCDDLVLHHFQNTVDTLLQNVHLPYSISTAGLGTVDMCNAIDEFYSDIMHCLRLVCKQCVPHRLVKENQYNIPGWNTYVREAHDAARECYLLWLEYGKPRSGVWFDNMRRTRAKFKLALRYCRQHVEEMKADACANSIFDKDAKRFWRDVYKISNAKATLAANVVGGVAGDSDIKLNECGSKQHFERLYSEKFV